jgi:mono/diheme cytochrome c family protein
MGPDLLRTAVRGTVATAATVGAAALLTACSTNSSAGDANVVAGKQLFVARCGSCHTLSRAGTKGVIGPNLDESFQQAIKDGLQRDGIRGAVHGWILHPALGGVMPAKLVTGEKAVDVAAYVSGAVARPGKDSGLLATAVKQAGGGKPAVAKGGTIEIDADPTGQLAYVTSRGQATPGKLTVESRNRSGTGHNIVIDGKGKGQVVDNGGVSRFNADFRAGSYTFYCSVPGHRQAGMVGKLVVK